MIGESLLEGLFLFFLMKSFHGFGESDGSVLIELDLASFFLLLFDQILFLFEDGQFVGFFLVLLRLYFEYFKSFKLFFFLLELGLELLFFLFGLLLFFHFLGEFGFVSLEFHMILQVLLVSGLDVVFIVERIAELGVGLERLGVFGRVIELVNTFHIVRFKL